MARDDRTFSRDTPQQVTVGVIKDVVHVRRLSARVERVSNEERRVPIQAVTQSAPMEARGVDRHLTCADSWLCLEPTRHLVSEPLHRTRVMLGDVPKQDHRDRVAWLRAGPHAPWEVGGHCYVPQLAATQTADVACAAAHRCRE